MLQTDEQVKIAVNLCRYFVWADKMRQQFDQVHSHDAAEMRQRLEDEEVDFRTDLLESEMYLCLWFSLIYVLVEGWRTLRIRDRELTELLRSPYTDMLRRFRNATFHPNDYDDDRIAALSAEGQQSIEWVRQLTEAFRTFFNSNLSVTV